MIIICVQNTSLDRNLEQLQTVDESVVVLIQRMLLIQEDLALGTSLPSIFMARLTVTPPGLLLSHNPLRFHYRV